MLDTASQADAERRFVFEEQIRLLYSKGLIALAANLLNSLILVVVLWRRSPSDLSLVWLGSMYLITSVRLMLWQRHRTLSHRAHDPRPWAIVWIVGTGLTGIIWGAAALVLWPSGSLADQFFVLFVLGGMVAGASATMSSYLPGFAIFTLPALAPSILRLSLAGQATFAAMAFLLFVFGVGMGGVAWTSGEALQQSVRLRFRNSMLLEELTVAKERLTQLNRELEDRVKARTQELEKALAYRDRLVSVVSHELRTPLGSMMLNQRLLQNAAAEGFPDATGLRRTIDVLSRQLDRLRDLVDDLLDTRRLASERMLLNKVPVDLRVIVTETLEEMAPQLSATGAKMAVVIGEGLRGTWDRHRIQQVLTNLISNALKYGHEPFVLTATRTDGRAQIVVSDHGKGIPREHLERIFQAFERGDTKERAPGLGLGLFIAERIVRAHDGSIRVESVPWQETRFIVELPLS